MTKSNLLWDDPAWQQKARAWIRSEASLNDIQLIGEIEQPHIRHWSTVISVESDQGMIFFKAVAPETISEIPLTEKLVEWYPDDMLELIAVDAKNGWLLMRDGGEQLRSLIRPTKDIKPWEPVIRRYAELQIGLSEHLDEMLSTGIPDQRLAKLPSIYTELLADEESLMLRQEKGLSSDEFLKCQNLQTRFEQICADLAAIGIPESLNHGDFHDANVLVKDGHITFFDWGDADITHPFLSLRTFFVSIEMSLDLDEYAFTPEMAELLNIYLKPFEKYASKDDLCKAFDLSKPVSSIVKTMSWKESIIRMDETMRPEYAWIVPELLREFLYHMSFLDGQV
ncbi:MAG: phosphotransferase [Anaerolineae bacterium]|nr:phosphotransferase [Anaerolineae bacterium]